MKITDMLFRSAGKELEWFGPKRLQPQEIFKIESLAATYGKTIIESDFEAWCEEVRSGDVSYPVSAYIRLADTRLKSASATEDRKDDPRIVELSAFVFTLSNRTPHPADIKKFLSKYELEEIQAAFRAYAGPMDDFELKFAVKNFFRDSGGEGVILSLRQQKEAAEKQARAVAASIESGIQSTQDEMRQRMADIEEADRRDETSGDKPF